MNSATLTAFPTYNDVKGRKSPSGCDCRFFAVNGIGLKVFRDRTVRDDSFFKQDYLHSIGLAPRVGNTFEMDFEGRTMYGHTTGIAEPLVDCTGKNESEAGESVYSQFSRRADAQSLRSDIAECLRELRGDGCAWGDDHPGNFGLLDGKIVIIDCAGVQLPGTFDECDYDNDYNEWEDGSVGEDQCDCSECRGN